jgi:hypothetical protein
MDGSNWRWGPEDAPDGEPFWPPPPAEGDGPSGIVILLVAALLVGGGYILVHRLGDMLQIQNCVIQGRTNCAPINLPKVFPKSDRLTPRP